MMDDAYRRLARLRSLQAIKRDYSTTGGAAVGESPLCRFGFLLFDPSTDFTLLAQEGRFDPAAFDRQNFIPPDPPPPFLSNRVVMETPRMSTLAIGCILSDLVEGMPPGSVYLNVGVWNGFSFFAPLVGGRECIGIDDFSQFGGPREAFLSRYEQIRTGKSTFLEMDYEVYLTRFHRAPIGVYFYDGNHSYRDQLRALELAEPFFVPGTRIVVDDTNDVEAREATREFMESRGGSYRIILDVRTAHNSHPTFWNGLMVIERVAGVTA